MRNLDEKDSKNISLDQITAMQILDEGRLLSNPIV